MFTSANTVSLAILYLADMFINKHKTKFNRLSSHLWIFTVVTEGMPLYKSQF